MTMAKTKKPAKIVFICDKCGVCYWLKKGSVAVMEGSECMMCKGKLRREG